MRRRALCICGGGRVAKENGIAVAGVARAKRPLPPSALSEANPPLLAAIALQSETQADAGVFSPGSVQWFERWSASIRYFRRGRIQRVRVSLDGGINYEGATVEEASQLCDERLRRRMINTGSMVRV